MRVIIQKPDLDTCLTALILGVSEKDEIKVLPGQASKADLDDPAVYCIEAGGSGLVHLNNFDHHDQLKKLYPACRQAYDKCSMQDERLKRLVDYVCMVDVRTQGYVPAPFPTLSNVFSGMLFFEKSPLQQFIRGIAMLRMVMDNNIDPFGTMPKLDGWREYLTAKEENNEKLGAVMDNAIFFQSSHGKKIGFGKSEVIGDFTALYDKGCDVAILLNTAFGENAIRKFAISSKDIAVKSLLLKHIDEMETGWGGHDTIICSPLGRSSNLSKEVIIEIVRQYL